MRADHATKVRSSVILLLAGFGVVISEDPVCHYLTALEALIPITAAHPLPKNWRHGDYVGVDGSVGAYTWTEMQRDLR